MGTRVSSSARLHGSVLEQAAGLRRPVPVSFEFFPPGDAAMEQTLWASVQRLAPLGPRFVSVTYGADGSTRERTHNVVMRILQETTLTPRAAPDLHRRVARGDPRHRARVLGRRASATSSRCAAIRRPGRAPIAPRADGFAYAVGPRARAAAPSATSTSRWRPIRKCTRRRRAPTSTSTTCARKIDAGATRAITQFFFDTDIFLRFRDRCAAGGIDAQIVPGILPITRFPQMLRFAERCGASVPDWLGHRFDGLDDDAETRRLIAASVAIEQVRRAAGARRRRVPFLHAEPRRADLRDLSCARRAAERRATGGGR